MQYLTQTELRRLFSVAYENNKSHHLAMVTGLWHGARVSEVVNLTGDNISHGMVTLERLKGSETTCQPIHRDSDPIFDESPLEALAVFKQHEKLFPFGRRRVDAFMKRYAALAGLHPSKGHFHTLKHSIAMQLWDSNPNLGLIQSYLGHKAVSSTLCYLRENDKRKAEEIIAGIKL
jgi:integrase